jgi:hypothetical protein
MSRQKFSLLMTGRVKRVRERDLRELARVLGVTEVFLSGGAGSTAPGTGVTPQMVTAALAAESGPGMKGRAARAAAEMMFETRQEVEFMVLMSELDRVFPLSDDAATLGGVGSLPINAGHLDAMGFRMGAMQSLALAEDRALGTRYLVELDTLRAFLAGTKSIAHPTNEELDEFAADMSRLVRTLVAPWVSGEMSVPPAGRRAVSTLAAIATGLINITVMADGKGTDPAIVDEILTDLERVVARLHAVYYEPSREELRAAVRAIHEKTTEERRHRDE